MRHDDNSTEAAFKAANAIAIIDETSFLFNQQKRHAVFISPFSLKILPFTEELVAKNAHIVVVTDICLQGAIFEHDLKWSFHGKHTQKSIANMIDVFNRFRSILNAMCQCRILQAFITSKVK